MPAAVSGSSKLHISPSDPEVILSLFSNFSLTCSGEAEVVWERDTQPIAASPEWRDGTFSSTLTLWNVTGLDTGEYVCTYNQSQNQKHTERQAVYVFVPGRGQSTPHPISVCISGGWRPVEGWG